MQTTKTKMKKRQFRIGELAKDLKVKKFVIRFWEKEFELKSDRSNGGQRFYTLKDLKTFSTIKDLLYNKKFTISGAKQQLLNVIQKNSLETNKQEISPAQKIDLQETVKNTPKIQEPVQVGPVVPKNILEKINSLKEKLINLKESLN